MTDLPQGRLRRHRQRQATDARVLHQRRPAVYCRDHAGPERQHGRITSICRATRRSSSSVRCCPPTGRASAVSATRSGSRRPSSRATSAALISVLQHELAGRRHRRCGRRLTAASTRSCRAGPPRRAGPHRRARRAARGISRPTQLERSDRAGADGRRDDLHDRFCRRRGRSYRSSRRPAIAAAVRLPVGRGGPVTSERGRFVTKVGQPPDPALKDLAEASGGGYFELKEERATCARRSPGGRRAAPAVLAGLHAGEARRQESTRSRSG